MSFDDGGGDEFTREAPRVNSRATDSECIIATNCNRRPTLAVDAAVFALLEAIRLILDG